MIYFVMCSETAYLQSLLIGHGVWVEGGIVHLGAPTVNGGEMTVTAVLEGQSPNYVDSQQVVVHVLYKGVELFVHGLGVEMGLLVDLEL